MIKLIDTSVPEMLLHSMCMRRLPRRPAICSKLHATAVNADAPVLEYHWEFGDGVSADGADVSHTYTYASQYTVTVTGAGLNGHTAQKTLGISVTGTIPTGYYPDLKVRYSEPK